MINPNATEFLLRQELLGESDELDLFTEASKRLPDRIKRDLSLAGTFSNDRVLLALEHEEACNSVLRTSARAIIEE